jgi:hypothetical protein
LSSNQEKVVTSKGVRTCTCCAGTKAFLDTPPAAGRLPINSQHFLCPPTASPIRDKSDFPVLLIFLFDFFSIEAKKDD